MVDTEHVPEPALAHSPLRIPIFRAVWIASIASNFGGLIQSVGASWLMTSLSPSPQWVALVQASTVLPIMLFSLCAGAIADNLERRVVMLTAQVFMLVVSIALAACAWTGLLSPWLLLGFTFLIGCGAALNGPAWQASVGDMVPRAALPAAVALNSMGFNIARSVGPAVGGAIVATAGAAAAFLTNAVSYVGLIVVLLRWHPESEPRVLPREPIGIAMAAGVRYVAMSPDLRVVLLRAALFGIAASAVPALMPLVARDLIHGGAITYGVLLGAFGIGAVAGALANSRLRNTMSNEWIVRGASLMLAVGAIATGLSANVAVTIVALMLAGAGWLLALSTFNVTVQMASPRWVVARSLSLYQTAAFGGLAIGSWLFGAVAEYHGVAAALAGAGMLQVVFSILSWWLPLANVENLDLDPLKSWTEPATALPIQGRSGPVVIDVQYRVRAEHLVEFLAAMSERRRMRRRDGAHQWTLLRDLADPEVWTERYRVATWVDYVRHNQRRTLADADNIEHLRRLQAGGSAPVVRRMLERQPGTMPTAAPPGPRELADPLTDATRSA